MAAKKGSLSISSENIFPIIKKWVYSDHDIFARGRSIYLPSYIYSFLFTIGFSLFVNWVMYFKLKKIDMVESLKSIE